MHGPRQSGNKVERRGKKSPSFSLPYNTYDTRITPRRGIRIVPFTLPPPNPQPPICDRDLADFSKVLRGEGGEGEGEEEGNTAFPWNDYCHGASICRGTSINFLGIQFTLSDVLPPFIWQLRSRSYLIGPARTCVFIFRCMI